MTKTPIKIREYEKLAPEGRKTRRQWRRTHFLWQENLHGLEVEQLPGVEELLKLGHVLLPQLQCVFCYLEVQTKPACMHAYMGIPSGLMQ
jgi:hypothetical protein